MEKYFLYLDDENDLAELFSRDGYYRQDIPCRDIAEQIFSEEGLKTYKKNINMQKALFQIFNETNKFVAVTMGSKGVYWVENNSLYHCNVPKVKTVETNCAGDVFHGAFATFIHKKYSILDSMKLATATATLKCTKNGGIYSLPSYASVRKYVKKINVKRVK